MRNEGLRVQREEMRKLEDLDEFSDLYNLDEIANDKRLVLEKRKKSIKDYSQRGEMLETILAEFSDMSEWFGEMSSQKTTEFDDRVNMTDVVLEGETDDGKDIYLAIDCTISQNLNQINKKIDGIIEKINSDELTTIKYFQSEQDPSKKGMLKFVPRVIIALDPQRMDEVCKEVLPVINGERGGKTKLARSYLQIFFLRQIEAQLAKQRELVNLSRPDMKKHRKEVAEAVSNVLGYIQKVLKEKCQVPLFLDTNPEIKK